MKYAITESKTVHIIRESGSNGWCGYWNTVCGKWTRPVNVTDTPPEAVRMCKLCQRKLGVGDKGVST